MVRLESRRVSTRRGHRKQRLARRPIDAGTVFLAVIIFIAVEGSAAFGVSGKHWKIKGDMSEACTCQVPCGCNFGQGPSPHHYCWSLMSLDIQKGHYGNVTLDGLHLARAHGRGGLVWYIDGSSTAQQAAALRAIATRVSDGTRLTLHFEKTRIVQRVGNKGSEIKLGSQGGFVADYIIGTDGKNPIVVENMRSWNVQHDIKGKTKRLYYKDQFGNEFDLTNTNANEGKFDWTDRTPTYF